MNTLKVGAWLFVVLFLLVVVGMPLVTGASYGVIDIDPNAAVDAIEEVVSVLLK